MMLMLLGADLDVAAGMPGNAICNAIASIYMQCLPKQEQEHLLGREWSQHKLQASC